MKKHKLLYLSIVWVCILVFTLFSFTYSWLKREWSPSVSQEGIRIQASSALAIRLDGSDASLKEINLKETLGEDVVNLQQISNCTGQSNDFFRVDALGDIKTGIIQHVDIPEKHDNSFSKTFGYVEIRFLLLGSPTAMEEQEVFLAGTRYFTDENGEIERDENGTPKIKDVGSFIRKPASAPNDETTNALYKKLLGAIRVSITVEGLLSNTGENITEDYGVYKTYCFMGGDMYKEDGKTLRTHAGITNSKNEDGSFTAHNQYLYTTSGEQSVINSAYLKSIDKNQKDESQRLFRNFGNFVNRDNGDGTVTANETTLFTLGTSSNRYITMRIWLEGSDEGCIQEISGLAFDLNLQFNSRMKTIEQPAS